jgi:hypothetical protein
MVWAVVLEVVVVHTITFTVDNLAELEATGVQDPPHLRRAIVAARIASVAKHIW